VSEKTEVHKMSSFIDLYCLRKHQYILLSWSTGSKTTSLVG